MRTVGWLAGAALVLATQMATAQERVYLGVGVGQSDIDDDITGPGRFVDAIDTGLVTSTAEVDGTDTGLKIFVGYRFHRNFAAELAYVDLGKLSYRDPAFFTEDGRVEVTGVNASLVAMHAAGPKLELFAKAGVFAWEAKASDVFGGNPFDWGKIDGTHLSLGLGANYHFSSKLGARLEWERFDLDKDEASLLSASLIVKF